MRNKLMGAVGMCKKAGLLVMGFDPVAEAAVKGKLSLIVLASDLSPKTAKEIRRVAEAKGLETVTAPVTMDEFWYLLGRRSGVLGVANQGLADKIHVEISRLNEED